MDTASHPDHQDDQRAKVEAELLAALEARHPRVSAVLHNKRLDTEPQPVAPAPTIPAVLAELGDEVNTAMLMLADDTFWLEASDPIAFRTTTAELLRQRFAQFMTLVAP